MATLDLPIAPPIAAPTGTAHAAAGQVTSLADLISPVELAGDVADRARAQQLFAFGAGLCLFGGDVAATMAAFLLAHWVRFVAPLAEAQALGLEQYARLGAIVAGLTAALFGL